MDAAKLDTFRQQLGLTLQRARAERGWSRLDLVSHCGVSPATIASIEMGKRSPRLDTFITLCTAFVHSDVRVETVAKNFLDEALAKC